MGTEGKVSGFSFPASPLASLAFLLVVWMLFFMAPCQRTDVNYCLIIKEKKTQKSTHTLSVLMAIELSTYSHVCGLVQMGHQPLPLLGLRWASLSANPSI